MTTSIERPTLSMYQFGKSWSSKTYQFGGTVVIQMLFDVIEVQQLLNGPPDDEWMKNPFDLWRLSMFNFGVFWT